MHLQLTEVGKIGKGAVWGRVGGQGKNQEICY